MGWNFQCFRNSKKAVETQSLFTTFDACNIIGMQRDLPSKSLLSETMPLSITPDVCRNDFIEIHAAKVAALG